MFDGIQLVRSHVMTQMKTPVADRELKPPLGGWTVKRGSLDAR